MMILGFPFRLTEIHWKYPVTGITEVAPPKNIPSVSFETKARQRTERHLDVVLTGAITENSESKQVSKCRAATPSNAADRTVTGESE
jgi:hypothetical protein